VVPNGGSIYELMPPSVYDYLKPVLESVQSSGVADVSIFASE
jgi:hypothetical protein